MRKATLIGPRVINAVAWRRLIPGLRRGLYDCVICGIEITSDKADEASLSIPYYFTFEQLPLSLAAHRS